MNIEGKQKQFKESNKKKNCREAKTFEGKQNYLKKVKILGGKQSPSKRILTY